MEKPIIEVKNIGKRYKITHQAGKYLALRDVIANILKKPFSFIADKAMSATGFKKKEEFWALRGVNFNIKKGEVVGIIGHNGAGKSTLLKILSQITPPTEGEIILRGTVGSLLEVGTGFHPELSGRENIFLNGAILGMHRREIASKFDQIVEFAGIEKFLDTPVKFYSSGMYVRLAFSVAAHMEPDILLVDEVLAVGDAEFQKKCLGKMDEITKKDGRTILFVSHNLAAIKQLCSRSILLKNGNIEAIGPTPEIIERYSSLTPQTENIDLHSYTNRRGDGRIHLTSFQLQNSKGENVSSVGSEEKATLVFSYECQTPEAIRGVDIGFSISHNGALLTSVYSSARGTEFKCEKEGQFQFTIDRIPLLDGRYEIGARVVADGIEADWPKGTIGFLDIDNTSRPHSQIPRHSSDSAVVLRGNWSHNSR
ncbi:MAG: ABC transporter ATP-binding protein [Patescibacteria group bacterium]